MQFEAIFEVFPEVKLGDLSALEVEKIDAQIDEAAIDRTIEILRKQRRAFNQRSAEQPAQDGDRVTIDFEGKIGGEPSMVAKPKASVSDWRRPNAQRI